MRNVQYTVSTSYFHCADEKTKTKNGPKNTTCLRLRVPMDTDIHLYDVNNFISQAAKQSKGKI